MLNSLDKKYKDLDVGPIYDIIVYHDGVVWNCIIDVSETGDLASGLRLKSYRETGDFKPLTKEDQLNTSMNVYEGGEPDIEYMFLGQSN